MFHISRCLVWQARKRRVGGASRWALSRCPVRLDKAQRWARRARKPTAPNALGVTRAEARAAAVAERGRCVGATARARGRWPARAPPPGSGVASGGLPNRDGSPDPPGGARLLPARRSGGSRTRVACGRAIGKGQRPTWHTTAGVGVRYFAPWAGVWRP